MASSSKPVVYIGSSNNGVATVLAEWKHSFLKAKADLAELVGWEEAHSLMPEPTRGTATFVSADRYRLEPARHAGIIGWMSQWLDSDNVEVRRAEVGNYVPFSNQLDETEWFMRSEEIMNMFGLTSAPPRRLPAGV